VPFPVGDRDPEEILAQNAGRQAAIVRRVREARQEYGSSVARIQAEEEVWGELLRAVEHTIRRYPLQKLQTIGGERVEFLYEPEAGRTVTLLPGVAFCFRAFYPMIIDMVEGAWSQYVRRRNPTLLGDTVELRSFLFGSERATLERFGPILSDLQEGACFYCAGSLGSGFHVDHFIPWRRYPVDLGHNFVLAHAGCNARKGDRLAAEEHLGRWSERNAAHADVLGERFLEAGVPADLAASTSVARWAYEEVERIGGTVWVGGSEVRALGEGWREVMG
jgi:5-methylcytosine-specific restriction endonuclease McrA